MLKVQLYSFAPSREQALDPNRSPSKTIASALALVSTVPLSDVLKTL